MESLKSLIVWTIKAVKMQSGSSLLQIQQELPLGLMSLMYNTMSLICQQIHLISFLNWQYEVEECTTQVDTDQSNTISYSFELLYLMNLSISYLDLICKVFFCTGYIDIQLAHGLFL